MMPKIMSSRPVPPEPEDLEWLKGIQALHPDAYICYEARPWGECETISAAVLSDPDHETTTIIVNVSMQWLSSLRVGCVVPIMETGKETLRIPQLVVYRENIFQFNQATEASLILAVEKTGGPFINFPWEPSYFHLLEATKRWIIWSLADENAKAEAYYWGFGEFGDTEKFEKYISERI